MCENTLYLKVINNYLYLNVKSLLHPPLQMPAMCLTEREVSVEHILFLFSFLYLALLKVSLQVGMFLKLAAA